MMRQSILFTLLAIPSLLIVAASPTPTATGLARTAPLAGSVGAAGSGGGGKRPQSSQGPALFNFGWVPVTFDTKPKPLDAQRRPKELDYRCTVACSEVSMQAVLTPDGKPLCYFQLTRALGAPYSIFGTWFEGEQDEGWESTCRGRNEIGEPTREWAMEWNVATQSYGTGYYCGCCGCTKNCYQNPALPPGCAGAYNLTTNIDAPCVNATRYRKPALPICLGETATQGQQWGTLLSDNTCTTVSALEAANPEYFCTNSPVPTTYPGDKPAPNDPPGLRRAGEVFVASADVVEGHASIAAASAALVPLPAAGSTGEKQPVL